MIATYLPIVLSSAAVYLFLIIGIRLFGKKEFAQLSIPDLIFVLLISNAVQNAMVGSNNSLQGGLVAASTLFIINYIFKFLLYTFPKFQTIMQGEAKLLIYKGKVNDENLRKNRITVNELVETIHEHGCHSILEVDLAILEVDGNISILSNDFSKKSHQIRKRKKKLNTQI